MSVLSWQGNSSNSDSYISNKDSGQATTNNRSSIAINDLLAVQLYTAQKYNSGGSVHDSFGIAFDVTNDNGLTPKDAVKPMNFFENLGINHNGTILSYESREMPQVGEVFSMYSSGYNSTEYVLRISMEGLQGHVFYLEDQFTGASIMLETGATVYPFSVSNAQPLSKATNRFSIRVDSIPILYVYESSAWTPKNPGGVSTAWDDILVINGTASLTANTNVKDLTINNGAGLEIHKVLNLNGNLLNGGNLVFVSNNLGNGELGEVPSGSIIAGNATVQRYMKNKRSYRMVSSSVTTSGTIRDNWQEGATGSTHNPNPGFGTHITGSTTGQNGFDATATGIQSMFYVPNGGQAFVAISNTDLNTLTAGDAYLLFVRGDRSIDLTDPGDNLSSSTTLRATGSLFSGPMTQTYNTTNLGDFVMFGNPYQSVVNVNSLFSNPSTTNVNTNHYYVYDPTMADHGAYVLVGLPGGTNTTNGSSTANEFIQPGQAAQFATLGIGSSALEFTESVKAPGNFTSTNRPMPGNDMLTVQLYTTANFNNGGPMHDSFGILFADGFGNELTPLDAVKPMNFYENLGLNNNGTYLSLEYREMPQPAEVYPLYSTGYKHSQYTLKMTVDGLEDVFFYLDDHFTGTSTLLEVGNNSYNFSIDNSNLPSIATDRFSIRTGQRLGFEDNSILSGIRLFPNPLDGNTFYINTPNLNGEQLIVSISDLSGRRIYNETLECRANTVTVPTADNLASGIYMVTLKHGGEAHTYKLIKK